MDFGYRTLEEIFYGNNFCPKEGAKKGVAKIFIVSL